MLENYPSLYDKSSPDYEANHGHWVILASELNTPICTLKNRVRRLITKYKKERALATKSSWRFFEKLKYLKHVLLDDEELSHGDETHDSECESEDSFKANFGLLDDANIPEVKSELNVVHSNDLATIDLVSDSSDDENKVSTTNQVLLPPNSPMPDETEVQSALEVNQDVKQESSQHIADESIDYEELINQESFEPKVVITEQIVTDQHNETQFEMQPLANYANFGEFINKALDFLPPKTKNKKILDIIGVLNVDVGKYIGDLLGQMPIDIGQTMQNNILAILMKR